MTTPKQKLEWKSTEAFEPPTGKIVLVKYVVRIHDTSLAVAFGMIGVNTWDNSPCWELYDSIRSDGTGRLMGLSPITGTFWIDVQ